MSWAEIKNALNSTVGTEEFQSLDEMIETVYGMFYGKLLITENKTFTVPKGVTKLFISGCGAGGSGANGGETKAGGKAGQYIIQEEVSVNPGDVFTITVGTGNTVITSTSGYNKTLVANSINTEYHTNILGWETGYNGYRGGYDGSSISPTASAIGGFGGAFGFGGGGGGSGHRNTSGNDAGTGGNGGSATGSGSTGSATLKQGGKGGNGSNGSSYNWEGGNGGDAGGYGAGGGDGGWGYTDGKGGSGSQGMVFIQWGSLQ